MLGSISGPCTCQRSSPPLSHPPPTVSAGFHLQQFQGLEDSQESPSLPSLNLEGGLGFCTESRPPAKTISPLHDSQEEELEFCPEINEKHKQSLAFFLATANSERSQEQNCAKQEAPHPTLESPVSWGCSVFSHSSGHHALSHPYRPQQSLHFVLFCSSWQKPRMGYQLGDRVRKKFHDSSLAWANRWPMGCQPFCRDTTSLTN